MGPPVSGQKGCHEAIGKPQQNGCLCVWGGVGTGHRVAREIQLLNQERADASGSTLSYSTAGTG